MQSLTLALIKHERCLVVRLFTLVARLIMQHDLVGIRSGFSARISTFDFIGKSSFRELRCKFLKTGKLVRANSGKLTKKIFSSALA